MGIRTLCAAAVVAAGVGQAQAVTLPTGIVAYGFDVSLVSVTDIHGNDLGDSWRGFRKGAVSYGRLKVDYIDHDGDARYQMNLRGDEWISDGSGIAWWGLGEHVGSGMNGPIRVGFEINARRDWGDIWMTSGDTIISFEVGDVSPAPIPLPASAALLLIGAAAFAFMRRRRTR